MDSPNSGESPLEAAAGAAGPNVIDAFDLLSNETRLAILLALWRTTELRTGIAPPSSVPE